MQLLQGLLVETGADPAGVHQPACVVDPQQQGAKAAARTLRAGIADHHELLAQPVFELDPVGAAARHIGAAGALADHPLEGQGAGAFEDFLVVGGKGFGKAQDLARFAPERLLERLTALFHRRFAQVLALQKGRIEQVIDDVHAATDIEGVLQCLEVRQALVIEHHYFAVQPAVLELQGGQGLGLLGQAAGPVVTVAGQQAHFVHQ